MSDQPLYTNRLIHQKSPYLIQHAHNPVDWYPWSDEAFEAAKSQDKPIFLSIGYATCHWCHVMERESFENPEVAQMMNETFINIKVDREEMPEVDSLYMEFAQSMMAGAAGWPLNVVLTPNLKPFFATTYLPPYSNHGMMGMTDMVARIEELWVSDEREKIIGQAEKIVEVFSDSVHTKGDEFPSNDLISAEADLLYKMADPIYGGIKGAPKFPIGYQYSFMLRYYQMEKDSRAIYLVEKTLDMMHRGGIYDHLGGGFSRYSTDEKWLVPHFEKMLYDNAILGQAYFEAWQLTKKPIYRQVMEEILQYLLRDMSHPGGGFYSAEDADSEGHEGYFYTWSHEEIMQLLGDKGNLFCQFYNVTPQGNFEKRNILNTPLSLEEFATKFHLHPEELKKQFAVQRKILWQTREKRVHPFKDDKILSSWNGLAIHTFAEASHAFNHAPYLQAAIKGAQFIKDNLWKEQKLLRRWRDGQAMFNGGLDEYAFMIRASISLFEAHAGSEWLRWAVEMTQHLKDHFKVDGGAFYQTDGTDKNLILRKCQFSDGAEPSGNAVHCENLLKLYQITGNDSYLVQAEDILKGVGDYLENYPPGYCFHVMNLQRYEDKKPPSIVIVLNSKREHEAELAHMVHSRFIAHKTVTWLSEDIEMEELIPSMNEMEALNDKTTLYICTHGVCQAPITSPEGWEEALDKLAPT